MPPKPLLLLVVIALLPPGAVTLKSTVEPKGRVIVPRLTVVLVTVPPPAASTAESPVATTVLAKLCELVWSVWPMTFSFPPLRVSTELGEIMLLPTLARSRAKTPPATPVGPV